jgi:hypothetical protein
MANYTVFDEGKTISGDARDLLERIRQENARENDEIAGMDVEQYAQSLIEDAPFFLPDNLMAAMAQVPFDSEFDRALSYLGQMPTSGVKILSSH